MLTTMSVAGRPGPFQARGSGPPSGRPPGSPSSRGSVPLSARAGSGPPGGRGPSVRGPSPRVGGESRSPGGRDSGSEPGNGSKPPNGRGSGPRTGNGKGAPAENPSGQPPGRGSGPTADKVAASGGRSAERAGDRGVDSVERRGAGPSGEMSTPSGDEAIVEINQCLRETNKLSESLEPEPTAKNIETIKKMVKTTHRMVELMVKHGPGGATDRLLRSRASQSGVPVNAQALVAEKELEEKFKKHIKMLQHTVSKYEEALGYAEKNHTEEFRGIMGPIVRSGKDSQ